MHKEGQDDMTCPPLELSACLKDASKGKRCNFGRFLGCDAFFHVDVLSLVSSQLNDYPYPFVQVAKANLTISLKLGT